MSKRFLVFLGSEFAYAVFRTFYKPYFLIFQGDSDG